MVGSWCHVELMCELKRGCGLLTLHLKRHGRAVEVWWTVEVLVFTHQLAHTQTVHKCGEPTPDETFPRLLRRQFDQLRLPEEEAENVGEDVVADDHGDREEEPDEAGQHVLHDEMRRREHNDQRQHVPAEERKLHLVEVLTQTQYERHETDNEEEEGDESMFLHEETQNVAVLEELREIFCRYFAVEEVVGANEEVPTECSDERKVVLLVVLVTHRNDLVIAFHLDRNNKQQHP